MNIEVAGQINQTDEESHINVSLSVSVSLLETNSLILQQEEEVNEQIRIEQAQYRRAHCALTNLYKIGYSPSSGEIIHPNNIFKYSQFEIAKAAISKLYELKYTPSISEVIHPNNIMNLNL